MFDLKTVELQLSELETLESIYPNEDEVIVQDMHGLVVMKKYVESNGLSILPTKKLHITLNMTFNDVTSNTLKVECTLPPTYPKGSLPVIFLRCDAMSRSTQQQFNADLTSYMNSIELGDCCLYQIVQWAVENGPGYITSTETDSFEVNSTPDDVSKLCTFTRMWIYSHHIYSKEKRKCILEWAKELNLTGFSMPGKPGVICVEGIQENCEDYWQRVKRLSWKHIDVRCREEITDDGNKFENMTEIAFEVHGQRNNHMDMGAFYSYLMQHNSEAIFVDLFGIAGKPKAGTDSKLLNE